MAIQLNGNFISQFSDGNGLMVGGSVTFYDAGSTTTKKAIYTSTAASTELANPQTLGSLGQLQYDVYMDGLYNIVIKDSNGIQKFQRDNFDATVATRTVSNWMLEAQEAGDPIGGWTEVLAESATVTVVAGDSVLGDSDKNIYKLNVGGNPVNDPESDTYDENTGVGTDWTSTAIANAPIHQEDLDLLQVEIDAIDAKVNFRGYLSGMGISNGTDADHDIDFESGTCTDSTGVYRMTQTSAFVKAIDAVWDVGTAQGGLASGLAPVTADTWFRVFAIGKTTSPIAVDYGFDTNASAANLLADAAGNGFDIFRQIGWVLTDSSANIKAFYRINDKYYWEIIDEDRALAAATNSDATITVTAPPNTNAELCVYAAINTNGDLTSSLRFHSSDFTVSSIPRYTADISLRSGVGHSIMAVSGNPQVLVDGSSQCKVYCDNAFIDYSVGTKAYYYTP